ncbi:MAG: hypothetical protein IJ125_09990 [Atopobiaceae bacterium]|nr:hypothetical protein [Atopobiaceae bacterium]
MNNSAMVEGLERAEMLLMEQDLEAAQELLARLAEDAEEYVDRNCPATDEQQWFSFPSSYERLAYKQVERDPRELHDVGEPLDQLYSLLALSQLGLGDYEQAAFSLKQAIRWNPMNCAARLDLAELYRVGGDERECLALSLSVIERTSDVKQLARAYSNFARFWQNTKDNQRAAAALRLARKLDARDSVTDAMIQAAAGSDSDPDSIDDELMNKLLEDEGIPRGANAEVAACLLVCARIAAQEGDRNRATTLTIQARDLVGHEHAAALIKTINEAE